MARMLNDQDPDDLEPLVFSVVSCPPLLPVLATIGAVVSGTHGPQSQTAGHSHSEICSVVWSKYVVFRKMYSMIDYLKPLGLLMVK